MSFYLEKKGYKVTQAQNGSNALELLAGGFNPDLILLDLMMPIKDGFEFRAEQQAHPTWSQIPVIVMSADGHVIEKKKRLEVDEYLFKPIDHKQLLGIVRKYLPLDTKPVAASSTSSQS